MAEEEKNQSAEAQAATVEKEKEPKEDFESKYKEMQAKHDQTVQELKRVQETLDAVTPYVNWEQNQQQEPEQDGYVSKKEVTEQLRSISESQENRLLELQFQVSHPELKGYENSLVAPAIIRARKKNPRLSKEQLLEEAAREVTDFLNSERSKWEKQEKEKKAKSEAEAMSGLESAGATSPKPEDAGQSNEDYMAERQKQLQKLKGN